MVLWFGGIYRDAVNRGLFPGLAMWFSLTGKSLIVNVGSL